MAYIPRSSFIPKEASGAIPVQVRRRRNVHVFGLIATVLLTIAVLGSVGIFFYNDFLSNQLTTAKENLGKTNVQGTEEKIEEIKAYDRKLTVAQQLLHNHLAPSRIFEELENSTKETVRFTGFEFTYDPGFDAQLTLSADTKELASVVLQQMQFSEDGLFSDFFVKDVGIGTTEEDKALGILPKKKISFDVVGSLQKKLLLYVGDAPSEENVITDVMIPQTVESVESVGVTEGAEKTISSDEITTDI